MITSWPYYGLEINIICLLRKVNLNLYGLLYLLLTLFVNNECNETRYCTCRHPESITKIFKTEQFVLRLLETGIYYYLHIFEEFPFLDQFKPSFFIRMMRTIFLRESKQLALRLAYTNIFTRHSSCSKMGSIESNLLVLPHDLLKIL